MPPAHASAPSTSSSKVTSGTSQSSSPATAVADPTEAGEVSSPKQPKKFCGHVITGDLLHVLKCSAESPAVNEVEKMAKYNTGSHDNARPLKCKAFFIKQFLDVQIVWITICIYRW